MKRFAVMPGMTPSLAEAAKWVSDNGPNGVFCPCCDQVAKVYRRKLNRAMAYSLICLYRLSQDLPQDEWMDVPALLTKHRLVAVLRSREYQKLCYWGLLESKGDKRADGGKAGMYRLTSEGKRFVSGTTAVPRHVVLYNGVVIEIDYSQLITIREALGDKFNYDELMQSVPSEVRRPII